MATVTGYIGNRDTLVFCAILPPFQLGCGKCNDTYADPIYNTSLENFGKSRMADTLSEFGEVLFWQTPLPEAKPRAFYCTKMCEKSKSTTSS